MQKIKNWGHRDDFDTMLYLEFWKSLNSENYKNYKNIHPLSPKVWNELFFFKSDSIADFIAEYQVANPQTLKFINLKMMFKALIKKMVK